MSDDRRSDSTDLLAPPGDAQEILPGIVRVRQDNPGPFTGPGTNTFLIGDDPLWILDPGQEGEDHAEAILDAVAGRAIAAVLVSHAHRDHWPLAPRMARETGAEIWAFEARDGLAPQRTLRDGEVLQGASVELLCLHTPGHCSDHLCFSLVPPHAAGTAGPVVFVGDHVMAWSTTVLSPRDGSLPHYLESLDTLIDLAPSLLLPAHGPAVGRPLDRLRELRDHRRSRTAQLLEALRQGPLTLEEAVEEIYTEVEPALHAAAAASLQAHVDALLDEGRLQAGEDGRYALTQPEGTQPEGTQPEG